MSTTNYSILTLECPFYSLVFVFLNLQAKARDAHSKRQLIKFEKIEVCVFC